MTRAEKVYVTNTVIDVMNLPNNLHHAKSFNFDLKKEIRGVIAANFGELDNLGEKDIEQIEKVIVMKARQSCYPMDIIPYVSITLNMKEICMFVDTSEEEISSLETKLSAIMDVMKREGDLRWRNLAHAQDVLVALLGSADEPLGKNIL